MKKIPNNWKSLIAEPLLYYGGGLLLLLLGFPQLPKGIHTNKALAPYKKCWGRILSDFQSSRMITLILYPF